MKIPVDVYSCEECGRAVVVECDQEVEVCPYPECGSTVLEYSHSGHVLND